MPNYALGKIYKLTHPDTDDVYIGSTCQKYLSYRLGGHKGDYKKWKAGKFRYVTSFKLFELGADDVAIELVECYPCTCKEEMCKKEGEHIKATKCLNKYVAGRTQKEYREENKQVISKKDKERYEDNKEAVLKKRKEWYQANKAKYSQKITCECGSVVSKYCLSRHKKSEKHQKFIETTD